MAEVKLKEETELWEPRGPCGSWGPAEEPRGPCGSWGPAEDTHGSGVEPAHLKEEEPELCIKQEPQEFPLHMVSVKSEEDEDKSSVLHQRATGENREETNVTEAGCSSDPLTQFHSDSEEHTDSSEDTEHSEDYSQQQAHSKRSYAMVPPDHTPYSCSECGKEFPDQPRVKRHMKTHTGEKPNVCAICKKGFAHTFTLSRHQKDVHHMCPLCQECFPDGIKLNEHLKTHVENGTSRRKSMNRHSCPQCEKEFKRKTTLRRHMLVHSGEKPFKCSVCERTFALKSNLKMHQKRHSGEKPYSCPVCDRSFTNGSHLTAHLRIHVEKETLG